MVDYKQPRQLPIIRKIINWISDIIYLKLLGGLHLKRAYAERVRTFILNITKIMPEDSPYVIEGKWSWCITSDGIMPPLTIVYPQLGLVAVCWGPEIGNWSTARYYCKNKTAWEVANRIASTVKVLCKQYQFHYLDLLWDHPIDIESLKIRLSDLLDKQ